MIFKRICLILVLIASQSCLLTKSVRCPTKFELKSIHTDKATYAMYAAYDQSPSPEFTKYTVMKKDDKGNWNSVFDEMNIPDSLGMEIYLNESGVYKCMLSIKENNKDAIYFESNPIEIKKPGRTYVLFDPGEVKGFEKLIVVYSLPENIDYELMEAINLKLSYFKQIVRDAIIPISDDFILMTSGEWNKLIAEWDTEVCNWYGITGKEENSKYSTVYDATTVAFVNILHRRGAKPVVQLKMHGLIYKCQNNWQARPLIYSRSSEVDLLDLNRIEFLEMPDHVISRELAEALNRTLTDIHTCGRLLDYMKLIKEHDSKNECGGAQYRKNVPKVLAKELIIEDADKKGSQEVLEELFAGS